MMKKTGYFPTLDGWRAVAILSVLISHVSDPIFYSGGPSPHPFLHFLTRFGNFGVDIFFGISGFLICSRLLQEWQINGSISLKRFYARRAFRILPPYFAYLIVLAFLSGAGLIQVTSKEWWSSIFFFRNYVGSNSGDAWYTSHFWSLAVEEHFYLIWPTLLIVLSFARPRHALYGVLVLALGVAAWRSIDFRLGYLSHYLPEVSFLGRTDIRFDGLLWGCCWAFAYHNELLRVKLSATLRAIALPLVVAFIVACLAWNPPLRMLWTAAFIPLLLIATVQIPQSLPARILESAPVRWIGRISYSLYIWNNLFLVSSGVARPLPLGFIQSWPFQLIALFACATLSHYLLERPLVNLGHRLFKGAPLQRRGQ